MRIILSYAAEYDKGEGIHFQRVLRRLGHEVTAVNSSCHSESSISAEGATLGFRPEVDLDKVIGHVGRADLFLYIEPLGLIPYRLEHSPIPTACVISDVHRNLAARQTLSLLFDNVFLYQRSYLRKFKDHSEANVHWFPWSCDLAVFRDLGCPRDIDVAFIGQLFGANSQRRRILSQLSAIVRVNEQRKYLQAEIPGIYSRAKIVINMPIGNDLNARVFEAISCGAMLLTRAGADGQDALFRAGHHYVTYDSDADLVEKVRYYLAHEEERLAIAQAGHAEVLKHHSLELRLKELLAKIAEAPSNGAPARRLSRRELIKTYAAIHERNGNVDALLALAAKQENALNRFTLIRMGAKSVVRRVLLSW